VVGERLQALARGHDPRPIGPRRRPERAEAHATFETPLDGVGATGLTLRRLAAELCDRLRARHLAPGRAVLTLRFEDAPALRVAQAFPQPALEPDWVARLLLSRIEAVARMYRVNSSNANQDDLKQRSAPSKRSSSTKDGGKSVTFGGRQQADADIVSPTVADIGIWQEPSAEPLVTGLTLAFDRLADPATSQLPAFEARAGRWEELRWSLERIRHRFGEGRLWRATTERPMAALPEHRSRLVDIGP
jgi:hypothetical protein